MYDDFSLDSGELSEDADLEVDTTEDVADTEEIDDGLYHARTNDEIFTFDDSGDLRSITDIQNELENGEIAEPYHAIPNDERGWEFGSLDDVEPDTDIDVGAETDLSELSPEEEFEKSIENMSLDELMAERNRLEQLSSMSDADIFAEYDQDVPNGSNDLLESLSKEQLEFAKQQLEQGNTDMENLFGLNGDVDDEDSGYAKVLRK